MHILTLPMKLHSEVLRHVDLECYDSLRMPVVTVTAISREIRYTKS